MKRIFPVLALLISAALLLSCDTASKQQQEEYDKAVTEALKSGVKKDSIMMGFHFGQRRQDYDIIVARGLRNGEFTLWQTPEKIDTVYRFHIQPYREVHAYLHPKFFRNRLVELHLSLPDLESDSKNNQELLTQSFIKTHGARFFKLKSGDIIENVWVLGNQRVTVAPILDRVNTITFTDLSKEKEWNDYEVKQIMKRPTSKGN
jgi:hypothetical protein